MSASDEIDRHVLRRYDIVQKRNTRWVRATAFLHRECIQSEEMRTADSCRRHWRYDDSVTAP